MKIIPRVALPLLVILAMILPVLSTGLPGIVGLASAAVSPAISTLPVGTLNPTYCVFTETLTTLGDYSPVYISFRYGETTAYELGNTSESPMTFPSGHSMTMTGLTPDTLYHYQAVARYGTASFVYGADVSFTTTTAGIPTAITEDATVLSPTSASLFGTFVLNNYSPVYVFFQYGTTTEYEMGNTTEYTADVNGSSRPTLWNVLATSTLYHYRIAVRYDGTSYVYGADDNFTTAADIFPTPTPTQCSGEVDTPLATNITPISATLNAKVCNLANWYNQLSWWGFYVSSDLGVTYISHAVGSGLLTNAPFSLELTGLEPDSLYYYYALITTVDFQTFASLPEALMTLQPDYTGNETIGNNTGFVPVLPSQPGGWIRPEKNWGSIGGVPWTFITYLLSTAFMVIVGLSLSKYIRKLAVIFIVLGFTLGVLCFWPKGGYLDWWVLFPYVLVGWALLHRQGESPIEE